MSHPDRRQQEEALIFLPGASGNTALWRPLSERLNHPGDRVFLGWPGFGPTPSDPSIRGIEELVDLVVRRITRPVTLMAQSMGGVIAVRAALERPEWVRRLVLSVTSGGLDLAAMGAINWRPQFRKENPSLPRWFEDDWTDLSDRLPQIAVPALLLWGDNDPISPVSVGERLAALLPDAELLVVPGGEHDLVEKHVDAIIGHVQRHLDKPTNPAPNGI